MEIPPPLIDPVQPQLIDPRITIAALVPALLALWTAFMQHKNFDKVQFNDPTIEPNKDATRKLGDDIHDHCRLSLTEPFVDLTVQRLQLSKYLMLLFVSLLSVAAIKSFNGDYLCGISFVSFSALPFFLNHNYVLAGRDVFHWWRQSRLKFVTLLFTSTLTVTPERFNFVEWFMKPYGLYSIDLGLLSVQLQGWLLFVIAVAALLGYLVGRIVKAAFWPSLRRDVLKDLAAGFEGGDTKTWMNKYGYDDAHKKELFDQLNELVYQGECSIRLLKNGTIIYGPEDKLAFVTDP